MMRPLPGGDRPLLILPVENQVRELDAKLLLAAVAAERGFGVVVGSQPFIFLAMPTLPCGVFVAKSMRSVNDQTLALIRWLGHEVVAWDEEALVRFDSPEYYPWRYSHKTFHKLSRLFCWGQNDADFFASYAGYRGAPIHVTGNPRVDLLRAELRGCFDRKVADLRRDHGRFVLLNTNFSFVNNHLDSLNLLRCDNAGRPAQLSRAGRGLSLAFGAAMAGHQRAIFDGFRQLLPALARTFPQTKFILRPHPAENHETWQRHAAGLPNVEVIHDGNVVPWLIACQGLLHNGCTTAVEAAVLGTPSISFQPTCAAAFDYHLPNRLSHQAFTTDAAIKLTETLIADRLGGRVEAAKTALLAHHVAATQGPLAVDRIVEVLVNAGHLDGPAVRGTMLARSCGQLGMRARGLIHRGKMRLPGHRLNLAQHAHQFPAIDERELNARVARFGACLGRFADIRVREISPHVFVVAHT